MNCIFCHQIIYPIPEIDDRCFCFLCQAEYVYKAEIKIFVDYDTYLFLYTTINNKLYSIDIINPDAELFCFNFDSKVDEDNIKHLNTADWEVVSEYFPGAGSLTPDNINSKIKTFLAFQ